MKRETDGHDLEHIEDMMQNQMPGNDLGGLKTLAGEPR